MSTRSQEPSCLSDGALKKLIVQMLDNLDEEEHVTARIAQSDGQVLGRDDALKGRKMADAVSGALG
jgi:hypothetical protein